MLANTLSKYDNTQDNNTLSKYEAVSKADHTIHCLIICFR